MAECYPVTNVLMCGVGGQGVILASDILSTVAMLAEMDVKKSEVHGMSQRGGVVTSHVRFGFAVHSPLIPTGQSDVILAFELAEGMRWVDELKDGGTIIINRQEIVPPITATGTYAYPENAEETIRKRSPNATFIDAFAIAKDLGNTRLVNTILLGILSQALQLEEKTWLEVIERMAPKGTGELNKKAFQAGRNQG